MFKSYFANHWRHMVICIDYGSLSFYFAHLCNIAVTGPSYDMIGLCPNASLKQGFFLQNTRRWGVNVTMVSVTKYWINCNIFNYSNFDSCIWKICAVLIVFLVICVMCCHLAENWSARVKTHNCAHSSYSREQYEKNIVEPESACNQS